MMYNAVLFSPSFISFSTAMLFQTTGTLLVAAAFCALSRKRTSAALRHLVWSLSLIGILGLPILYCALSPWPAAPHLRLPSPSRRLTQVLENHDLRGTESAVAVSPSVSQELQKTAPPVRVSEQDKSLALHAPEHGSYNESHTEPTSVAQTTSAAQGVNLMEWLVRFGSIVYVSGTLLLLSRLGIGLAQLSRLRRMSLPITDTNILRAVTEAQRRRGHIRSTAQMSVRHLPSNSQAVIPPMTWGVTQPVVLLPTEAASWPDSQIVVTLLHEMAHIERRDWPIQIMAQVTCAFYWFHPLVWIAARALRAESENACDDRVICSGVPKAVYANHLLDVARFVAAAASIADAHTGRNLVRRIISRTNMALPGADTAIPMASHQRSQPSLEIRLRAILQQERNRQSLSMKQTVVAMLTGTFLVFLGSALRVSAAPATTSPTLPLPTSIETPRAVPGSESYATNLPNGVSVRLVGVADTQQTERPTRWWAPSGMAEDEKLGDTSLRFPNLPPQSIGRAFAVAATYDPAVQPQIAWAHSPNLLSLCRLASSPVKTRTGAETGKALYPYPPAVTWDFRPERHLAQINRLEGYEKQPKATTATISQVMPNAFLATDRTASVRVGVAAGPWTQSVDCPAREGRTVVKDADGHAVSFTVDTNPHQWKDAQAIARGNAIVMARDRFGARGDSLAKGSADIKTADSSQFVFDRVFLALDKNGSVVYDLRYMCYPDGRGGTVQQSYISNALLKQVWTFRVLARPFRWAEFGNVSLNPQVAAGLAAQDKQPASVAASVAAHIAKGRSLTRSGQPGDGKSEFLQAVALDPNNAEAQYCLALSIYSTNFKHFGDVIDCRAASPKDTNEAILHMKQAVALRPQNASWHSTLGTYLSNRGNYAEAIVEYRRSLRLLPEIAPYNMDAKVVGIGSTSRDALMKAFGEKEKARQIADGHWLIADTLMKTREYSEALHHYRIASAFQPKADWVLLGMGDALYHLGQLPEARQGWKQVVKVGAPNTFYSNIAETRLKQDRVPSRDAK